ncbi:amidohydrolase family protein [Parvularcula flava]|uniref:Amidohydrolase family protein n=1 Tax=Aquisalinus luteolus TaxID=1566827 RepID=A0A8J3EQ14_9PROT|nr:amidohydrolase family protein [Aquisalinus luteolus]NHK26448.1 amidohydrolase family protein [Aquisalinus luteolus]GGH92364.1 D-glutamate deacylase [Aquisalinus luteolus]
MKILIHTAIAWAITALAAACAQPYDIVLTGGRVIDPETGLDAVRNVAINGDRIAVISEEALDGETVLDVSGSIVAPGFIDLHAHGQNIPAARMKALDGVTTALELESGVLPVAQFYDDIAAEGRPINYGAAAGWAHARIAVLEDVDPAANVEWFLEQFSLPDWQKTIADEDMTAAILTRLEEGLDEGAIGIGVLLGYAPETGHKEYYAVNQLAADKGVPTFTHARYLNMLEPHSSFEGFQEMIAVAASTGAQMHISHLNSLSVTDIELIADMVAEAQSTGVDLSVEAYPYGAGATGVGAAMFRGEGWKERIGGVDYSNFTLAGKPLDKETFDRLQAEAPGTEIIIHFLDPANDAQHQAFLDRSILFPGGVIASDGGDWAVDGELILDDTWPLPEGAKGHPRSAGTYGRFLRQYVRERSMLTWPEAIAKASYYPAEILGKSVPQMRERGRVQEGAIADIIVIDPEAVSDRATFETPGLSSVGFDYVIVSGEIVVRDGELDVDAMPGQPIRGTVASE